MPLLPSRPFILLAGTGLIAVLAGCGDLQSRLPGDFDLRGLGNGFSTAEAAQTISTRPTPDARGIISYPSYQVVVAQQGDTVSSIATRIGLDANALARHNGLETTTFVRAGEVLSLPSRVAEPSGQVPLPQANETLTANAAAVNAAGSVTTTSLAPLGATAAPSPTVATTPTATASHAPVVEPTRHPVVRGETAYTIARRYNVPVRSLAEWNGLDSNMTIREGQYLLIPTAGATAPSIVTRPGAGSPSPVPPSAGQPMPSGEAAQTAATAAAAAPAQTTPNLGAEQSSAASSQLRRPVAGNIIRAYAKGRNEGIDIGAAAGTQVQAAAAGTVAAVTTNTDGITILVIRHEGNLMTVYTHLDNLTVQKDSRVTAGQTIGKVRAGSPSFLHFEVRRGLDSIDPTTMLP